MNLRCSKKIDLAGNCRQGRPKMEWRNLYMVIERNQFERMRRADNAESARTFPPVGGLWEYLLEPFPNLEEYKIIDFTETFVVLAILEGDSPEEAWRNRVRRLRVEYYTRNSI